MKRNSSEALFFKNNCLNAVATRSFIISAVIAHKKRQKQLLVEANEFP